jgi:hypothetical protein
MSELKMQNIKLNLNQEFILNNKGREQKNHGKADPKTKYCIYYDRSISF